MKLFDETKIAAADQETRQAPIKLVIDGKPVQGRFHIISQQVQAAADIQIDKTFGDDILVTAFGQKLLPMQLVFIALPPTAVCLGDTHGRGLDNTLAKLYEKRHAGRRRSSGRISRIAVTFDGVTFEGVLTAMNQVPHNLSGGGALDVFRYTFSIQGNFQ